MLHTYKLTTFHHLFNHLQTLNCNLTLISYNNVLSLTALHFTKYLLIFFLTGQESANDDDVSRINESQDDDDERALALATDPDLTDLDENEWETFEWLTPEGKFDLLTMYYTFFPYFFRSFQYVDI